MQFTPFSESEATAEANKPPAYLLQAGEGDYEVMQASEYVKQYDNGSESRSIKLTLKVWDANGKEAQVFDYINPSGRMAYKFRHACYSCGLGHAYESGNLEPESFIGKSGRCVILPEPAKGEWKAKNTIKDYIVAESTKETENYEASKTGGQGAASAQQQMRAAWSKFQAANVGKQAEDIAGMWQKAFREYFPGKTKDQINAMQWTRFAADGFRMQEAPFADAGGVPESDIPF